MSGNLPFDTLYEIYRRADFREQLIISTMLFRNDDRFFITEIPDKYSELLDDQILQLFPHLTDLAVGNNMRISDDGIKRLTKLQRLSCRGKCNITDASISHLANLKFLDCAGNKNITQNGLVNLKKLETLVVRQKFYLSNDIMCSLKKLRAIWIDQYDDNRPVNFDTKNTNVIVKHNFVVDTYQKWLENSDIVDVIITDVATMSGYFRRRGDVYMAFSSRDIDCLIEKNRKSKLYILYRDELISGDEILYPIYNNYSYFPVEYDIDKIKQDIVNTRCKKIIEYTLKYNEFLITGDDNNDYVLDASQFKFIPADEICENAFVVWTRPLIIYTCIHTATNKDTMIVDKIMDMICCIELKMEYREILRNIFVQQRYDMDNESMILPDIFVYWIKNMMKVLVGYEPPKWSDYYMNKDEFTVDANRTMYRCLEFDFNTNVQLDDEYLDSDDPEDKEYQKMQKLGFTNIIESYKYNESMVIYKQWIEVGNGVDEILSQVENIESAKLAMYGYTTYTLLCELFWDRRLLLNNFIKWALID